MLLITHIDPQSANHVAAAGSGAIVHRHRYRHRIDGFAAVSGKAGGVETSPDGAKHRHAEVVVVEAAVDVAIGSYALCNCAGMAGEHHGREFAVAVKETLDAGGVGTWRSGGEIRWAVQRRVFRNIGIAVDRKGVLADDLALRVDSVGDRSTHVRNGKIDAGELPVFQLESVLFAGGNVKAHDIAARVYASCARLTGNLAWDEARRASSGVVAMDINGSKTKRLGSTLRGEQQQPKYRCENQSLRISQHLSPPWTNLFDRLEVTGN